MRRTSHGTAAAAFMLTLLSFAAVLTGCRDDEDRSDAYGHFEADEIVVSAESSGRLIEFRAREGARLSAGEVVAVVDTAQLVLQRATLRAQHEAAASRMQQVRAQLDVLDEQQRIAARERERFAALVERDAAPEAQLDQTSDRLNLLEREARTVRSQLGTIQSEVAAVEAQIAQIEDQIERSVIRNPVDGIVLTSFAEPHELATMGRPLYEIANVDTLFLRAFVTGDQLPAVRLGERVGVLVDAPSGGLQELPGAVSWIASEAEFTPKLIQTRENRADLVYAVRIRVPNPDGLLKIGMPGEVSLP